jgi:flagellar biogenesis protein FliO
LCIITTMVCAWPSAARAQADGSDRLAKLAQRYAEADGGDDSVPAGRSVSLESQSAATEAQSLGVGTAVREAEPLGERDSGGAGWAMSTLAALGLVIGLILVARFAYIRFGGRMVAKPTQAVEVLSRTTVAPKNHVLLLRVGQRVLVVGDSNQGLRTLADVDDPEEVAGLLQATTASQPASVTNGFQQLVSRFNRDYDAADQVRDEGGDQSEIRLDKTRDTLAGLTTRLKSLGERSGAA